jgi:hypothetical protein
MARFKINGGVAWHAGHQGPGTGMDADTCDGIDSPALIASDRNLKRDIAAIAETLSVEQLTSLLVSYQYDKPEDIQRFGVIAQDLQAHDTLNKLVREMPTGYLSIDPFSVLFYFVNSLAAELTKTKQELASLKKSVGIINNE